MKKEYGREYSRPYCNWLIDMCETLLGHLEHTDYDYNMWTEDEIYECSTYIRDYDDGDFDIHLPTFIDTLRDYAKHFGLDWEPIYDTTVQLPIARKVYASTIPNPDYEPNNMLLLG
jgi:hypothetical protein